MRRPVTTDHARRRAFAALAGLALGLPLSTIARLLEPTPAQTAGPFYPEQPPKDNDSDLTRVRGRAGTASGLITDLGGRVFDRNGTPVRGARVEIWQCDALGRYHHPRDSGGERDEDFQGFGAMLTDTGGAYRFRTIKPVPYPGRTPHIHFAVFAGLSPVLVTQLYVAGEPRNASDFLFNAIPVEQRDRVQARFTKPEKGSTELVANFDIILGETPRDR